MEFSNTSYWTMRWHVTCMESSKPEHRAKYMCSRLRGHALEVYKEKLRADNSLREDYGKLDPELGEYFKDVFGGRTVTTGFYSRKMQTE